jgi:hypothetical protein
MGGVVLDTAGKAISTAPFEQRLPAIAFDGTNYFVVWDDSRSGGNPDIYGARVTMGGVVLDPGGIAISTAGNSQYWPNVAFDGTNYLVVWWDQRSGNDDIYGARVSVGGVVLDTAGIAISTAPSDQRAPAVAFDGSNYLVLWEDNRSGWNIYGARVTVGGVVLDPGGIAISSALAGQWLAAVAFDGTNYLVVWDELHGCCWWGIYGARVTKGGVVLDPGGIAIATPDNITDEPAVAFDGTNYLVVWADYRSSDSWDIYGARVTMGGVVLDPEGIAISTVSGNSQDTPAVAFDGTNYFVVWQDSRSGDYDIYGARVSKSGTVLDPDGFTGLTFASATATSLNRCVTLSWQMAIETPATSFVIRRSESSDGEFSAVDVPIIRNSRSSFSGTDCSVEPGRTYWYAIVLVGALVEESYGPIEVHVDSVPTAYGAYQSYPNPFNPACTIPYDLPVAGRVRLQIYDVDGSPVRTLVDSWREAGLYSEVWDGRNDAGRVLPSGVYFYRFEAGEFVATRKVILLK